MELDQAGHRLYALGRVAQGPHALPRHARPHHLVVVEGDPARADAARLGLAHVVEEGGQTQDPVGSGAVHHRDGVGQHVLVPVDGVLLEGEGGQLGQELVGQARVHHERQPLAGALDHQQLVELDADPLGRHDAQPAPEALDRADQRGVGLHAIGGDEAGGPQHAQGVVLEGDLGSQRRAQAALHEVDPPLEGIDQLGVGQSQGHGVDGEVTAGEVGLHLGAEGHVRLSGVRVVGLGPVGRDLVAGAAEGAAHGAEAFSLQPHRVGPAPHHRLGLLGEGVGREVEVGLPGIEVEQRVSYRAAHDVEAVTGGVKAIGQRARAFHQAQEPLPDHAVNGSDCVRR